jgi:hypothetical protein
MNARLHRRALLSFLAVSPLATLAARPSQVLVEVWKDPECGCCKDWVSHLQAAGFAVKVHANGNDAMRARLGMPQKVASCHTALVGGYALEGHVPARDVRRLLKEKPRAVGLTVPGMPVGAPGMDGPIYGKRRDPYEVLLVLESGETQVYSAHNKA